MLIFGRKSQYVPIDGCLSGVLSGFYDPEAGWKLCWSATGLMGSLCKAAKELNYARPQQVWNRDFWELIWQWEHSGYTEVDAIWSSLKSMSKYIWAPAIDIVNMGSSMEKHVTSTSGLYYVLNLTLTQYGLSLSYVALAMNYASSGNQWILFLALFQLALRNTQTENRNNLMICVAIK